MSFLRTSEFLVPPSEEGKRKGPARGNEQALRRGLDRKCWLCRFPGNRGQDFSRLQARSGCSGLKAGKIIRVCSFPPPSKGKGKNEPKERKSARLARRSGFGTATRTSVFGLLWTFPRRDSNRDEPCFLRTYAEFQTRSIPFL